MKFALGSLEEIEVWLAAKCLFSLCHCATDAKFPPQISKGRPARSRRTPPPCNPHSTPHAGEAKATALCRDTSFTQCKFVPSFCVHRSTNSQLIAASFSHLRCKLLPNDGRGAFGLRAEAPFVFLEKDYGALDLARGPRFRPSRGLCSTGGGKRRRTGYGVRP